MSILNKRMVKAYRYLIVVIFVHIIFMECNCAIITETSCERHQSCVTEDAAFPCSICHLDPKSESGFCVYTQTSVYKPTPSCERYTNDDCPLHCGVNGHCSTTSHEPGAYYYPYCSCRPPFYGDKCQYWHMGVSPRSDAYVRMRFSRSFPVARSLNAYYEINIQYPKHYTITVEFGQNQTYNLAHRLRKVAKSIFDHRYIVALKGSFPYRLTNVYQWNGRKLGYNTVLTINVFYKRTRVYKFSNEIFVSYGGQNLKCIPIFSINNCMETPGKFVSFTRGQSINLEMKVDYIKNGGSVSESVLDPGCEVSEIMTWVVRKVSKPNDIVFEKSTKTRNISFGPYTLEHGLYRVFVQLANIKLDNSLRNYKYCYFNVVCRSLVAVVAGGSERTVSAKKAVILSGRGSHDPNRPKMNQRHVIITWSCVNILDPKKRRCPKKTLPVYMPYIVRAGMLTPGAKYQFTLMVWTNIYGKVTDCDGRHVSPRYAFVNITVVNSQDTRDLVINCLKNCGSMVIHSDRVVLKASQVSNTKGYGNHNTKYIWTYYRNEEEELSTDSISVIGVRPQYLIIKSESLDPGTKYTIVAREENSSLMAKYQLETYVVNFDTNCTVYPESGVKGETYFSIDCTKIINPSDYSLSFEFFDKDKDEANDSAMLSGRMLGTSKTGLLSDVRLTRGILIIYLINEWRQFVKKSLEVELSETATNNASFEGFYENIAYEVSHGSVSSALNALSFIPDIISSDNEPNKKSILNKLLGFVTKVPLNELEDIKLSASALSNVLMTKGKPNQLYLKPDLMQRSFSTIKHQAQLFSQKLLKNGDNTMNPTEVKEVSKSLMNCIQSALSSKDKLTDNLEVDDIRLADVNDLRQGSYHVEKTLDLISNSLSYHQTPGEPVTNINSNDDNYEMWVMESDDTTAFSEVCNKENNIPVQLDDKLELFLKKQIQHNESLALQIATIKENIFWWSISDVQSKLVSISIKRKLGNDHLKEITHLKSPISVLVEFDDSLNSTMIQDSMLQIDPDVSDADGLDLAVKIHRFDPDPLSLVKIQFLFPPTNSSLRVLATYEYRPDHEMMTKKAVLITDKTPDCYVPFHSHEERHYLYVAITPDENLPTNQSVAYAFNINTTICQSWTKGQWSTTGCRINTVEGKKVHCGCTHLSIFSAAFPVPPNKVDPFADVTLFLTVFQNPIVFSFVLVLIVLYLFICLLVWWSDKKANRKRNVIVLEDNFPGDAFPYLIAVFTNAWLRSGTTAHVGFRIEGSLAKSRNHIFSATDHKILQREEDDWFLIFCPNYLGNVESMTIWHDNTGSSPDWFCNKIIVYDVINKIETLFIVREWLALTDEEFPEIYVLPASIDQLRSSRMFFYNNVVLGLRENHVLLSCIDSHPRSGMTKVQRVSIFMCCLMVSMLCSIMFYLPEFKDVYIDDYHYNIGTRHIYVALETIIISAIVTSIIYFLFKNSYKMAYVRKRSSLYVRESTNSAMSRALRLNQAGESKNMFYKTFYKNFVKIVSRSIKTSPMEPAQLPGSEPIVQVRPAWLAIAWIVCITIIGLSSYLIMLYGFRLGLVSSKEWLSSILLSMSGELFIFAPIRIIFISSLLAVALHNSYDIETHHIDEKHLRHIKIPDDDDHIFKLLHKRSQPMYFPLSFIEREEMLKRNLLKKNKLQLLDFVCTILFILLVNYIIVVLWTSQLYSNVHTIQTITKKQNGINSFNEVNDVQSLEEYLEQTFVDSLYSLRWYNDQNINEQGVDHGRIYWARDFTLRMLGLPVVRQLRVVFRPCGHVIYNIGQCIPRWSSGNEDKDVYRERWRPALWTDQVLGSPWGYTEKQAPPSTARFRMYSPSGNHFTTGGYIATLSPTRRDTALMLADLRVNEWIDMRTTVVIVEVTLYNVNEQSFTQVTLMVEHLISGPALLKAQAASVKTESLFFAWNAMFLPMVVYNIVTCVYLMSRQGIGKYISQHTNVFRLFIVSFGILTLIIVPIQHFNVMRYLKRFLDSELDSAQFDFDSFSSANMFERHTLSMLECFLILQSVVQLKLGRSLLTNFYTFMLSLKWIFWLSTLVSIIVFILICITNVSNIFIPYRMDKLIISKNSTEKITLNDLEYFHVKMLVMVKIAAMTICMWFYVMTFGHYTKLAKTFNERDSDDLNWFSFILSLAKK